MEKHNDSQAHVVQDTLRESEARHRTLIDAIDAGFCIIEVLFDAHGKAIDYVFVETNPAFERHSGIVCAAGRRIREFAPDLEEVWFERYGRVVLTGESFRVEDEAAPLGRWFDINAFRIGRPEQHRVAVLVNDITARRQAEKTLRELNETLERRVEEQTQQRNQLWRLSRSPFLVSDLQGIWISASPAWTEILGWTETDLIGRTSEWMEHPDDRAKTRTKIVDVGEGEVTTNFVNRFRDTAGHYHWFSWTAVSANDLLYCVALDVTEQVAQTEALVNAEESLRHSQKMEAVGQLTGGIAHDFNNLLASVSTSLQVLRKRLEQGRFDGAERYIQLGMQSVDRAAALTQRLLAFSRRQTLDPKPVDVNRLVHGFEDLIERTVGPAIDLRTLCAVDLWLIRVDAFQLENAVLNLCINARDAMPDGGTLTIETANQRLDEQEARRLKLLPGEYVRVAVTDTGSGMDDATKARVFDPFFTTKPIGQGTGLGLSMVHGFIQQSGGQVRIDSKLGHGTTVSLCLPRYMGEVAQEAMGDATKGSGGGQGETILVIEDEMTIRSLLTEVFQDAGYAVMAVEDGPAGMRILETSRRIDLLVTDVGLPGSMNGRQVADAARTTRPDLKVLFVTGYADKVAVGDGNLPPGMEVMSKPFDVGTMVETVSEMLDRP